jgi:membrane associated rhomboid family serine protease
MLEDRSYMRDRLSRTFWPASIVLMVVLVVIFALQCINDVYLGTKLERWLALTPECITRGRLWQLFTFQFLHGGILHLLCNLLGLWFIGRFVETAIGQRRFLVAYFASGVVGGIFQCVLMVLFPGHFGQFVYGASAGVSGIFAVFARLLPDTEVRWNFILPIRADVLLWAYAGIELFFTLVPSVRGGWVAHAAHLGGILAGVAFVRMGWHQDFRPLPGSGLLSRLRERPRPPRRWGVAPRKMDARLTRSVDYSDIPSEEFISREVDPILDKISAHGIQSLTERERRILEAARAKMSKR